MTDSTFPSHPHDDLASTPPTGPRSRRRVLLVVIASAVALVVILVAVLIFALSRPSALSRVAEACGGTASIDQLTADAAAESSKPDEADGMTPAEITETFGEYFAGVVSVEDEGRTLIVATKSADDDPLGVSSLALSCVQDELEMPTWLVESINTTRALGGRQSVDWDGFDAQRGYHPDNGLSLIIVQK